MKLGKLSWQGGVLLLYAIFLVALSILPQYKIVGNYKTVFALSLPFWGYVGLVYPEVLKKNLPIILSLFFIGILTLLGNSWMGITAAFNTSLLLYLCIFPYFLFEIFARRRNSAEIFLLIGAIVGMLAFVCIKTWIELIEHPGVARLLAYGTYDNEEINLYRNSNIGGFGFCYAIGMLNPYLLIVALRNKGCIRTFVVALWILSYLFCLKSQYTTLLFLTTIFSVYVLSKKIQRKWLRSCIVIGSIVFLFFLPMLLIFLSEHMQFDTLAYHFRDFAGMLTGEGSKTTRNKIYRHMITIFVNNPIWGVDLSDYGNMNIINHAHSTLLGLLAGSGIVITSLFYYVYYLILRNTRQILPNACQSLFIIYSMLFSLSVVNPITTLEINLVVVLLIPLLELHFFLNTPQILIDDHVAHAQRNHPEEALGN